MVYYVVVPNLMTKGMSPAKCLVKALLEINKEKLAEGLKFFAHDDSKAKAYLQDLPSNLGRSHCMVELSIDHDAEPFLTKINGVERFYSIHSFKALAIAPQYVSALHTDLEKKSSIASASAPKNCTPISDSFASDPGSVHSSTVSRSLKKLEELDVLDDMLLEELDL
ncbi:MAG: hypothetical protein K0S29_864 [Gammaproteobacteria bacterium]|nr:hypothetical protein [Gammaproteobacteria bacterium]